MSADPRVIMVALQDLIAGLQRWSVTASDVIAQVGYRQRLLTEQVEIALHHAGVILDLAQQDEERVQDVEERSNQEVEKCTKGVSQATAMRSGCMQVHLTAKSVLQHWREELAKAQAWLARARKRLEAARIALQQAESELRSAEWDLDRAYSRLRAAQSDKERSNTWGEQAAVSAAQARVSQARQLVAIAQQEVLAAEEEVARAEARVALCEQAVQTAEQAVSLASQSVDQAETSLNHAERSLETARAAQNTAMRARQEVNQEYQSATEMLNRTRQGQSFADEGRVHLSRGEKHEAEAQMDVSRGRREVEDKIEILREVNRPTLGGSSGGFGGSSGSSGISGRSGGIGSGSGTRDAVRFVDGQGRSITIKQHNNGDSTLLRAYEGSAPETPNLGVGRANLHYESSTGKLKLQDIEVDGTYQGSGIGGKLRTQVEQLGRQYGASEIYGVIENDSARAFWQGQAKYGWRIIDDGTAYGSVIFRP